MSDADEDRADMVLNGVAAWSDWILSFIKMDRSSRSNRRFFREYAKRTRYPVLTREILESLTDSEIDSAIVDYVRLRIDQDYSNHLKIVSSLSPGIRAVYSTWWVQCEVANGGFHQYFYNQGVDWAFTALEGYKLLGANDHAELVARAIDIYLKEEPEQLKLRPRDLSDMLERYVEARSDSTLPELDNFFYDLKSDGLAIPYIRAHIDEFVTVP